MASMDARESDLELFETRRQAFESAIEDVPETALGYLKEGDDYTLGGLVLHVNVVLDHYLHVLEAVCQSTGESVTIEDAKAKFAAAHAAARRGLPPEKRHEALADMDALHQRVLARLRSVAGSDWTRTVTVAVGSDAPYPASPADVLGWLSDHYQEHIPQVEQLLEDWKQTA